MSKILLCLCILPLILIGISFTFIYLRKKEKEESLTFEKSPAYLFVGELIGSIVCMVSFLVMIDSIDFYHHLNLFSAFLTTVSGVLVSALIVYNTFLYRKKTEMLFLTYMIPLGIVYMFLLYPDFVPDEQSHFMKAFNTSMLNFSADIRGVTYGDYSVKGIETVHDLLQSFYIGADTTLNVVYDSACSYNFLIYIVPALGLWIGRILHFSIYLSYYLGRFFNFLLFLYIGYKAIQIIPKYKWLVFVFYFNPMLIQQGISFSADMWLDSFCIFAVAYFFYLYEKEEIEVKDIYVVMTLIGGVLIAKYVYFTLFGIYLLLVPKLFRMPKKNWLHFLLGMMGAGILFVFSLKLAAGAETVPSIKEYLITSKVDGTAQMQFLLSKPENIIRMYQSTFITMMPFYISSFISNLGWLEISLNAFSILFFYLLLFSVASVEHEKCKGGSRIWILVVGLLLSMFIILGLYLHWTPVGSFVTLGVQGRYFIPVALLLLVGISNGALKKLKPYMCSFCIGAILLVQFPAILNIFQYMTSLM